MKAHINTAAAKPLALYYGLAQNTKEGLCAVLDEMQITGKEISRQQLSQPVGVLAGIGGKTASPFTGDAPEEQLLLLSNFERSDINRLLDTLSEAGISIPLKAIVTKHNKSWSILSLLEELGREREAVRQYEASRKNKEENK